MDAKCPRCDKRATLLDDMSKVVCKNCGYENSYDEYIEDMKSRVYSLLDDFMLSKY